MAQLKATQTLSGPGRLLVFVYGIFALAATARAGVQIATRFEHAPVAYSLSALAALIYLANTVLLARPSRASRRAARVMCLVELVGVLVVGVVSLLVPQYFPDPTVWSEFGIGYGFVPLVLPILGLIYLRRSER
ncbi:hypothetical protein EK0264_16220 [Epidermidibacterium keratini]|uniref:Integral membrane protein n=1 Tax=Epidermidibacterium keratini TaxID=1891644 RepID=A0A7L4YRI3_9ACTN|nr:hypothetical protein [Epidermidibacterium keratini]QHC01682.1 hypothetical protein EK0264_16220 [Epidermidibacterium keratini]